MIITMLRTVLSSPILFGVGHFILLVNVKTLHILIQSSVHLSFRAIAIKLNSQTRSAYRSLRCHLSEMLPLFCSSSEGRNPTSIHWLPSYLYHQRLSRFVRLVLICLHDLLQKQKKIVFYIFHRRPEHVPESRIAVIRHSSILVSSQARSSLLISKPLLRITQS